MPHLSFRSCKNPVSGTRMTRRMMSPTAFLAVTVFVVVLIMCHPASKRLGASRNLRLTERQSSETKNVNFTGKWVLHKIEGDIDQFFKDQDWSWAFRKVAVAIVKSGYYMSQKIHHAGDKLRFEDEGIPRNRDFKQNYELTIGGSEVPWITPNAERARLRADWNEDKTQIIQRTYGEKFPKITQRYLDGDYMVEIARCQGHNGKPMDGHVKHVYRRCC
ncbi:hypothetical protein AAMO2058_000447600 [Amorphochlora amoebiformis]|mmetsp:Transcript_1964/g.2712  ORF Transcript_1964/g.2712 Transcript_1964/m.2712 type:complete len:218 (-) Transcript_1964:423-1076(-)